MSAVILTNRADGCLSIRMMVGHNMKTDERRDVRIAMALLVPARTAKVR